MAMNTRLIDNVLPVPIGIPKSYSSAALATTWLSLKNYNHVSFLIITGAWAAGTAAVTVSQGKDVSGTGSKALAFASMWVNTAALIDTFVKTAVVSNTFNLDTANLSYVIEVDAATLDVDNGFITTALAIASPGANADFYAAYALLSMARYAQAALPTSLLN